MTSLKVFSGPREEDRTGHPESEQGLFFSLARGRKCPWFLEQERRELAMLSYFSPKYIHLPEGYTLGCDENSSPETNSS